jgi:uncharacterized alpha-E superfamily protein
MLSRIAGNCFWLARYLERAENGARLIGVAHAKALLGDHDPADPQPWLAALRVISDLALYRAKHPEVSAATVASFLVCSRDNPSSLVGCFQVARTNARTARDLVPDDYWEEINDTWLASLAIDSAAIEQRGLVQTLEWFRSRCRAIRGASHDLLQDELPQVLAAGQATERIDFLARLLRSSLTELINDRKAKHIPGTPAYQRLDALLSAAGALEMYRRSTHGVGSLDDAVHILVADPDEPHALVASIDALASAVEGLTGGAPCPALSDISALRALVVGASAEFLNGDWHGLLGQVVARTSVITNTLERDHFSTPEPAPIETVADLDRDGG